METANKMRALNSPSTQLLDMPTELLRLIANNLPCESEASLTLTCKHLKLTLGTRSWISLREKGFRFMKVNFLKSLSRDHSMLLPCDSCALLHQKGPHLKCPKQDGRVSVIPGVLELWFTQVELLMRTRYTSPQHRISLEQIPIK